MVLSELPGNVQITLGSGHWLIACSEDSSLRNPLPGTIPSASAHAARCPLHTYSTDLPPPRAPRATRIVASCPATALTSKTATDRQANPRLFLLSSLLFFLVKLIFAPPTDFFLNPTCKLQVSPRTCPLSALLRGPCAIKIHCLPPITPPLESDFRTKCRTSPANRQYKHREVSL